MSEYTCQACLEASRRVAWDMLDREHGKNRFKRTFLRKGGIPEALSLGWPFQEVQQQALL